MRGAIFAALAILASASAAQALPNCPATPRLGGENYPGRAAIPTGNNLILPTGKSVSADGQRLIVTGHLVDAHCIPLVDASVEMWQVDPFGHWLLAGRDDLATPNPTFAGAGRTYTDADGNFTFITAFPAAVGKRAPHLHFRIKAEGMGSFSTIFFFENDNRNGRDPEYRQLSASARHSVTLQMGQTDNGDLTGTANIALPGTAKYQTY